jgi:hypothetical protein
MVPPTDDTVEEQLIVDEEEEHPYHDGKYARLNLTDMCLDSRRACEALTLLRNQHGCTLETYVFARGTDGQAVLPKNAASDFFAKATSSNVGALRNRIETDANALVKVEKLAEADAS